MGLRTEILEAMRNTALRLSLLTEFSQGRCYLISQYAKMF